MSGDRIKSKSNELTRAELEIMQILWDRGPSLVHDVLAEIPEPKPAYNTISTVIRVLEKKGFVDHKAYGKTHEYFAIVDRDTYTKGFMTSVLSNFFGGSASRMVSFLSSNDSLSLEETDEILKLLKKE